MVMEKDGIRDGKGAGAAYEVGGSEFDGSGDGGDGAIDNIGDTCAIFTTPTFSDIWASCLFADSRKIQ